MVDDEEVGVDRDARTVHRTCCCRARSCGNRPGPSRVGYGCPFDTSNPTGPTPSSSSPSCRRRPWRSPTRSSRISPGSGLSPERSRTTIRTGGREAGATIGGTAAGTVGVALTGSGATPRRRHGAVRGHLRWPRRRGSRGGAADQGGCVKSRTAPAIRPTAASGRRPRRVERPLVLLGPRRPERSPVLDPGDGAAERRAGGGFGRGRQPGRAARPAAAPVPEARRRRWRPSPPQRRGQPRSVHLQGARRGKATASGPSAGVGRGTRVTVTVPVAETAGDAEAPGGARTARCAARHAQAGASSRGGRRPADAALRQGRACGGGLRAADDLATPTTTLPGLVRKHRPQLVPGRSGAPRGRLCLHGNPGLEDTENPGRTAATVRATIEVPSWEPQRPTSPSATTA